jgi:uncharacterized membrane protein YesL
MILLTTRRMRMTEWMVNMTTVLQVSAFILTFMFVLLFSYKHFAVSAGFDLKSTRREYRKDKSKLDLVMSIFALGFVCLGPSLITGFAAALMTWLLIDQLAIFCIIWIVISTFTIFTVWAKSARDYYQKKSVLIIPKEDAK